MKIKIVRFFFNDIKFRLEKYNYIFHDMTINFNNYEELDFYSDGQHLTVKSSEMVTIYLANFLKKIL